jgi:anti-sigma factor RsiW
MTCEQAADLVGPYVDDALPLATRRAVEAHLLACAACAWDAQTQRIARERLREETGGEVVASDAFRARTLARLVADNPHLHADTTNEPSPFQLPIPI